MQTGRAPCPADLQVLTPDPYLAVLVLFSVACFFVSFTDSYTASNGQKVWVLMMPFYGKPLHAAPAMVCLVHTVSTGNTDQQGFAHPCRAPVLCAADG